MLAINDIVLVQASFARLVPMQDAAADLFYDRLFALTPKLRELFPSDLRDQKRKLMQMIATAVGGLNRLDKIIPAVKALGARSWAGRCCGRSIGASARASRPRCAPPGLRCMA
jgi:hemoglobin-like flavoprotein